MTKDDVKAGSVIANDYLYWVLQRADVDAEIKYIDSLNCLHEKRYVLDDIADFLACAKLYACPRHQIPFGAIDKEKR